MNVEADSTSGPADGPERPGALSRRGFLGAMGGVGAGAAVVGVPLRVGSPLRRGESDAAGGATEPFYGERQGGIITPPQSHTYFAALDFTATDRRKLMELLQRWTALAAGLTSGQSSVVAVPAPGGSVTDSGETEGLGPARLTVNIGFGPGLFGVGGPDRFGLAHRWPIQLAELPAFPGDALSPSAAGGDLTVHACADDPQVAFHAVRQLVRSGAGVTTLRWSQAGFNEAAASPGTPRNLLGFKDGTSNPSTDAELARFVWAGPEAPSWMAGGTYLVIRRIRIDLEQWDAERIPTQEQIIGRSKASGAPLGRSGEFDALDLNARDLAGRLVIPLDAHVRLASAEENWGATLLRRSYSYTNSLTETGASGSAPALDAGLLFVSYQRDPRLSFIPLFQKLAGRDALSGFTAHTGSAIAAIPPAAPDPERCIGQDLFD